jgi:lysophospholipase L1-like esterase
MRRFPKRLFSGSSIAIGLAVLSALLVGHFAWMYRRNSNFRNDLKIMWFDLSASGNDRRLLLLGDSRIAAMSCASDLAGWRILNLGVSGSEAKYWTSFVMTRAKWWHFTAIVLWVGINDIVNAGRAATNVAPDILNTLRKLDVSSNHIVLINSQDVPAGYNAKVPERIKQELIELANVLMSNADGNNVSILTPLASVHDTSHDEFYADYIHLNERGYRVLCAELAQWLAAHG